MQHQDILEEARRILGTAEDRGVTLRLLGGVAIQLRCPSAKHRALTRKVPDIDFIGLENQSKGIKKILLDLGYVAAERFNALHGKKRLLFNDAKNNRQVDIFLDRFEMCHKFDFRHRLAIDRDTLPVADLLITKLQIIKLNEKDYKDILCLLKDYETGKSDTQGQMNYQYIAALCSKDWGLWRTFTMNLERVLSSLDDYDLGEDGKALIRSRIKKLLEMIEAEPKSLGWKARSKMGEKIPWYDEPATPTKITFD